MPFEPPLRDDEAAGPVGTDDEAAEGAGAAGSG